MGARCVCTMGQRGNCNTQKQEIQNILEQEHELKERDKRYLIATSWMKQWKQYVGYDLCDHTHIGQESAHPGPVQNSDLIEDRDNDTLKSGMVLDVNYSLLPLPAWEKLTQWYTLSAGSRPIVRSVINGGMEVYPLMLRLCVYPETKNVVTKQFSETMTTDDLELEVRHTFHVPNEVECQLWHGSTQFSNQSHTLSDEGLLKGETIILEKKNENGTWPKEIDSPHTQPTAYQYQPGLCGLANLGNTCFMNSALQCLSNTQPLTEYFVGTKAAYREHINSDNSPLGMDGAIAEAYGMLLGEMWSGKFNYIHPQHIKEEVGRYAPQFMGFNQQDAQELLTFLLNGIHEDLNLVKQKPYFNMSVATEGEFDKDVAEECWYNYLRRNQSVVVKVFQGQLKSTLDCPDCRKITRVFDPFTFLSLPLPVKETRSITVTLIWAEHQEDPPTDLAILKYKVTVPKSGCIADLKKELTQLTGISADMMVIDVYNRKNQTHQIICGDSASLSHIPEKDTFVHELMHPIEDQRWVQVLVYHRLLKKKGDSYKQQPFGPSVVVCVDREQCTYLHLYQAVLNKCRKYVKPWPEMEETGPLQNAESSEPMEVDEPESGTKENEQTTCQSNGFSVDRDPMDTDKNAGVHGEDVPTDGALETGLFQLEVVRPGYDYLEVEQLKNCDSPITSQIQICCNWSLEVKMKCYNPAAYYKSIKDHESCTKDQRRNTSIPLSDCLDLFTTKMTVGKENAWYCPGCRQPVQVSRKCLLWKLPEILIIYLKRFCYTQFGKKKDDAMVDFPVSGLSLKSYTHGPDDPEAVYDLFATINHVGGLAGGHYTAYCKNSSTGNWYTFNDTAVSEIKTGRIVSAAAYVLFYHRRSEGYEINNSQLTELFAEEMHRLEAKFQPRETDATSAETKGEKESTGEERQKQERKQEEATDKKETEEEKHQGVITGEDREGEEREPETAPGVEETGEEKGQERRKGEEEEPTSEEERGEEEETIRVEKKGGEKQREDTGGKKGREREQNQPEEGSCSSEEEEGVESEEGISGEPEEQEGKFKPHETDATIVETEGETGEERQKQERKQEEATDKKEEKHQGVITGEDQEGEEREPKTAPGVEETGEEKGQEGFKRKGEEEEPTSEEERGEEEETNRVEKKGGEKQREDTGGKKGREREQNQPEEGSCSSEEEEGVESEEGISGEPEEQEGKFKLHETDATNAETEGEKESTGEERQKQERKQEEATDKKETEEEKHQGVITGEDQEGEEREPETAPGVEETGEEKGQEGFKSKREEEEHTSEEERGEEEETIRVEKKGGEKQWEDTGGKKGREREQNQPEEGSCSSEEEEGVESEEGISEEPEEQEGKRETRDGEADSDGEEEQMGNSNTKRTSGKKEEIQNLTMEHGIV